MTGIFCQTHQEYSPSGLCRWCEPPQSAAATSKPLSDLYAKPLPGRPSPVYVFTEPEWSCWLPVDRAELLRMSLPPSNLSIRQALQRAYSLYDSDESDPRVDPVGD